MDETKINLPLLFLRKSCRASRIRTCVTCKVMLCEGAMLPCNLSYRNVGDSLGSQITWTVK